MKRVIGNWLSKSHKWGVTLYEHTQEDGNHYSMDYTNGCAWLGRVTRQEAFARARLECFHMPAKMFHVDTCHDTMRMTLKVDAAIPLQ